MPAYAYAILAAGWIVWVTPFAASAEDGLSTAARWGAETLARIQSSFYLPATSLYAEQINDGKPPRPAWIWDASMQLGALCSAARQQPRVYLPQVKAYAAALRAYR